MRRCRACWEALELDAMGPGGSHVWGMMAFISTGMLGVERPWRGMPVVLRRRKSPSCCAEAGFLRFSSMDFEVRRSVGSQGWLELTEWEYSGDGAKEARLTMPSSTVEKSRNVVRLFDGMIVRGPLRNSRVLLKEFCEGTEAAAKNEMDVYMKLFGGGGPFGPGVGDSVLDPDEVPIATLLGSFEGSEIFDTVNFQLRWRQALPGGLEPPKPGNSWLVFRWEGTLTAASFGRYKQEVQFGDRFFPDARLNRIRHYLRILYRKSLSAIDFVHSRGLVHKSIGPESILVNTLDASMTNNLEVKLKDFGFSLSSSGLSDKDLRVARENGAVTPTQIAKFAQAEDLYCLGYTLMQVTFSALARVDPTVGLDESRGLEEEDASLLRFKRLTEDVFDLDMTQIRSYCAEEPRWGAAVSFLDERDQAGWKLLGTLLGARREANRLALASPHQLTSHPFLL